MAGSAALQSSSFLNGKYRDLRDPSRYHTNPDCPVGTRIPGQFVHPGAAPNGRPCRQCGSDSLPAAPTLYRV